MTGVRSEAVSGVGELTGKQSNRNLWGFGNVLYLDLVSGYMGIYIFVKIH